MPHIQPCSFAPRLSVSRYFPYRFFTTRLLSAVCIGLLTAPAMLAEGTVERLPDTIRPTFQSIHLQLDPSRDNFDGETEIHLDAAETFSQLRFHFRGVEISQLILRQGETEIPTHHTMAADDLVLVEIPERQAPGSYQLQMKFVSPFGQPLEGVYRVQDQGDDYIFSVFQPIDARRAFPCWDEPIYKIPFQVTLTVPVEHEAVSNTPVQEVRVVGQSKTVSFEVSKPLPSYGVAVASGPFEVTPIDGLGIPGRLLTVPGQGAATQSAVASTQRLLKALETYFGMPYPYAKLDLLAVPGFPSGALENPAAAIFSTDILLLDPQGASLKAQQRQALLLAHELSHMWFGNLVTLAWWDDVWLNESFATWMSYKLVRDIFPELEIETLQAAGIEHALTLDSQRTAPPIRRSYESPMDAFSVNSALVYEKGSEVLGMFERWVGEAPFRRAVQNYLLAHAWGNARADDLWHALDEQTQTPVSTALQTFLEQPGFPLLTLEQRGDQVLVRQTRFRDVQDPTTRALWQVPVTLRIGEGPEARTLRFLLDETQRGVDLSPSGTDEREGHEEHARGDEAWIEPKVDAVGYYRWALSSSALLNIAGQASEQLTLAERLDVLANAGSLLKSGQLPMATYLGLLEPLGDDPHPAVVKAVSSALADVKSTFVPPTLASEFARFVRVTLSPAIDRLGSRPQEDSPAKAQLRSELVLRLGKDGEDRQVREDARRLVDGYLEQQSSESSSSLSGASWRQPVAASEIDTALHLAALDGDRELFDRYHQQLDASHDGSRRRALLVAMASFPENALKRSVLDGYLSDALGPGDLALLVGVLLGDEEGAETLYRWMKENYDPLTERLPPIFLPILPRFAGGCSAERVADAKLFFGHTPDRAASSASALMQVEEEVAACLRLRLREKETMAQFLSTYSG